ncbi:MAG: TIGR04282 family arsenosugar biosynthesis glycosyltransferase [Pseudomonadota bacterium]|nr:TIGR04282 family arsenosugar biosynthesis glycosyltransferase [Pseudomonadota bacterium]
MSATRIVIFAKAPVPGKVKTRLIPMLGEDGAAELAKRMLADTVAHAVGAGLATPELCATPHPDDPEWAEYLPAVVRLTDQGAGDLGQRMAAAAQRVTGGGQRILLIGTDCPELGSERLAAAALLLEQYDAVIHPALDGGYVLLGLARTDPSLFDDIAWSTETVAATTIARIKALGWSLFVGDTMRDVDEPADLEAARASS